MKPQPREPLPKGHESEKLYKIYLNESFGIEVGNANIEVADFEIPPSAKFFLKNREKQIKLG